MKAVLISIRPNWCKLIWAGVKTVEVRRSRPKLETPFKCYIYCTKAPKKLITIIRDGEDWGGEVYHGKPVFITWNGVLASDNPIDRSTQMVVGEFICDDIRRIGPEYCAVKEDIESAIAGSCLSIKQVKEYAGWDIGMNYADMKDLYGWHISDLKIYKEPVKLKDFWGIQPCNGKCRTCRRMDVKTGECKGENLGIDRPPQSWCYVEVAG